jgi:hypothetical protein
MAYWSEVTKQILWSAKYLDDPQTRRWWMFQGQWWPVNWPKIMVQIPEWIRGFRCTRTMGMIFIDENPPRNKRGCEITHKWRLFSLGKSYLANFPLPRLITGGKLIVLQYSFFWTIFKWNCIRTSWKDQKVKFLLGMKRSNMTQVLKM